VNAAVDHFGPGLEGWYHTIELGDGQVTRGHYDHRTVVDRFGLPASLEGMTVLDVGTGDGFFAFEMERRGADRVVAIDVPNVGACDWVPRMRPRLSARELGDSAWPDRFAFAHARLGSKVEYRHMSVYDLDPRVLGTFDLVVCGSLLLHLQNPLGALHRIRSVTAGMAIVETAIATDLEQAHPGRPIMVFGSREEERRQDIELGYLNSYWLFTTQAVEDMLAYADFVDVEPQGVFELPPHGLPVTAVTGRVT
jgi:SAM-dependent methyltransferase